jgi:hypothetical protein
VRALIVHIHVVVVLIVVVELREAGQVHRRLTRQVKVHLAILWSETNVERPLIAGAWCEVAEHELVFAGADRHR